MDKLDIVQFGTQLLHTGDLDPVYVAIFNAKLDHPTRARLCLAYWCFYHLGFAAKLAEQKTPSKFWALFEAGVINEDKPDGSKPYPRGAERRHFRGANAKHAYEYLRELYKTPEQAALGLVGVPAWSASTTYGEVAKSVQTHTGFGPWIAFKIADMAERSLDTPVDFSDCHLGIYKDPRQGAAVGYLEGLTAKTFAGRVVYAQTPWDFPITDEQLAETVGHYVKLWRGKGGQALGGKKRPVNVQEIETIFCKYKSHLKGHYPVGKDTREIAHGLDGWGDLAQQLKRGLPNVKLV